MLVHVENPYSTPAAALWQTKDEAPGFYRKKAQWYGRSFFPKRLSVSMVAAGHSKLSLSKKLGVAHTTVAAWLKGSEPGAEKIIPLAKALGVDAHWLLTGDAQQHTPTQGGENDSLAVSETPEHIETLLAAGPGGAAAAMSGEQLHASLVEWAAMLPGKPPYMQKAILGNLTIFIHELSRRLDTEHSRALYCSKPTTKKAP